LHDPQAKMRALREGHNGAALAAFETPQVRLTAPSFLYVIVLLLLLPLPIL